MTPAGAGGASPRHTTLDGPATRPFTARLAELYNACYSRAPWHETPEQLAAYPAKLAASLERPGFTAHLAHGDDGRLAGACYGWPSPADLSGSAVYDALIRALGAPGAADLTRGAFEIAELFVHPGARGRGLGRQLLTAAVAGRPAAWLITSPKVPAADLYRRLGWEEGPALPRDLYPRLPLTVFAAPVP